MAQPVSGVVTISCPDRKGIVASVTKFLAERGANILDASQHSDLQEQAFFMRVQFELEGMMISREEIAPAFEAVASEFEMKWQLHFSDRPKVMAVLVSKLDHCLYDLLLRQRAGEFFARIPLIISNHEDMRPVAQNFGIPYEYLPVNPSNRVEQESAMLEILQKHRVDLVVLARYMQVLSPRIVQKYPGQIINIHHSFLPAFVGGRPYHQAYERGVKMIGATSHYVTEDLDQGPIIAQDVTQVTHRDSVSDLVRKGRDLERVVLARAVRAHLEDRVLAFGRRTVVFE
ncbi:MAG TPA: formyltetrahydrofolate deformylase [Chloroflexia bacterium]|nr:formyltetrahydrofolate deformylase [Chloroflexia bacterium]